MTTINRLLELLATHKGKIVSTASLSPFEIRQAEASNRMFVDANALGFVWIPDVDIPITEESIEQFEEWYPLDELSDEQSQEIFGKIMLCISAERTSA